MASLNKAIKIQEKRHAITSEILSNVVERAARTWRNPATGETITIPAKTVVKATAAKSLIGGA